MEQSSGTGREAASRSRRSLLKLGGAGAVGAAAAAAAAAVTGGGRSAGALTPGSGSVYDVVVGFGADNTGATDATAAIQAAIDAARATHGGTVFFPVGTYKCDGPLNADESRGIWLVGSGAETAGAEPGTQLFFGGSGPSFISARSTAGFALHRLGIAYTNSAFTGYVVDFAGGQVSKWDTAFALVSDCVFSSGGGEPSAAAIINLDKATSCFGVMRRGRGG